MDKKAEPEPLCLFHKLYMEKPEDKRVREYPFLERKKKRELEALRDELDQGKMGLELTLNKLRSNFENDTANETCMIIEEIENYKNKIEIVKHELLTLFK